MFNVGDEVVYEGGYRNACAWVLDKGLRLGREGWTIAQVPMKVQEGYVVYASHPNKDGMVAFYAGDFVLAKREPEPYEGWFV